MEVPRLRVELELQLLAYATATPMPDQSRVCNLHHSSRQHPILNPLSKARDQTRNLMVPSRICFHCTTTGIPESCSNACSFPFRLFFFLFRAAPVAYGSSQARGRIRAIAAGLHHSHSNTRSEPHLQPTPQLMATPDPCTTK